MFAEDVGVISRDSFATMLSNLEGPENFSEAATLLWNEVGVHGGELFANAKALPLNMEQVSILLDAAGANWSNVEVSIFGTLIEQALSPSERHRLGAHYTPTDYVKRLVVPTVMEDLRRDWADTVEQALNHVQKADIPSAKAMIVSFYECLTRVLIVDPACGSGNFLAVSLIPQYRSYGQLRITLGS